MQERILDLGCGKNKYPGAIGLDMNPGVNPDIVFEFKDRDLLPLEDNSFDEVHMKDFIEHVDDISWLLSEVHRVSRPDSKVYIRFPHYSHKSAYSDVTHTKRLGVQILDHFDPSTKCGEKFSYYTLFGRNFPYKIEDIKLDFSNTARGKVSNLMRVMIGRSLYESYVSHFMPINNVEQTLRVLK